MKAIFAKVVELETTQVLFFIDTDPDNDSYRIHQIFYSVDGFRVDVALSGFQTEERCLGLLERFDKDYAAKLVVDSHMTLSRMLQS